MHVPGRSMSTSEAMNPRRRFSRAGHCVGLEHQLDRSHPAGLVNCTIAISAFDHDLIVLV